MRYFILLSLLVLSCFQILFAQRTRTVLFSNVEAGAQVVEIDFSEKMKGRIFTLSIVKNGAVNSLNFVARSGKHYYDLSGLNNWTGQIDKIYTNLPEQLVSKRKLVNSSLFTVLDAFLVPSTLSLRTVNFLERRTLLGYPFTIVLLSIVITVGIFLLFVLKTKVITAFFLSLLLTFILSDAREVFDRWEIRNQVENTYPLISPKSYVQDFIKEILPIMDGGAWTFRGKFKDEYFKICLKYQLADSYYYPDLSLIHI